MGDDLPFERPVRVIDEDVYLYPVLNRRIFGVAMRADGENVESGLPTVGAGLEEEWVYENGSVPRLGRLQERSTGFRVEFDDGEVVEGTEFLRRWVRVLPGSFHFRKVREPDALRSEFEEDPTTVVVLALEALAPVSPDKQRLKETLTAGGLIDEDLFDRQWKKAQTKLKKHPHVIAEGRPLVYRYLVEPQVPVESNQDLLRELAQKSTPEARSEAIRKALKARSLTVVEAAWLQSLDGDSSVTWASLVGQSVPQEAAVALRDGAVRAATEGDLDAVRFLAELATDTRMKAVGEDCAQALSRLPASVVDGALAGLVNEWSAWLGGEEAGSLKRLRTRLQRLAEIKRSGPELVGALLRLSAQLSDDSSADARRLVERIARVLSPVPREDVEHGAGLAAGEAGATAVAMGVRSLRFARRSVRESVLRGILATAASDGLAEVRIWDGVTDAEIVRLVDDEAFGRVLSADPLRGRLVVPAVARYVRSADLRLLLSLLAASPALRQVLDTDEVLDRTAQLSASDDHVVAALDHLAGSRWVGLVEELEEQVRRLHDDTSDASVALRTAEREREDLRSKVGELQAEIEQVRRTSGAQARFDALKGLGESVVALAVWSSHPDRLTPREVFDHAVQRARARGLQLVGEPGSEVDFDSERHELLAGDPTPRVTVVEPGVVLGEAGSTTTLLYAKVQRIER